MKPTLDLYVGRYVSSIVRARLTAEGEGEPWQWGIRLDDGTTIYNKDRRETFVPQDIVGARIKTVAYSVIDTTIHFSNGHKWSLTPTQYAIADPHHGGEVYPQWPEELEEAGIPSHPEEGVSDPPKEGWHEHREELLHQADARHQSEAQEFLAEEGNDDEV
jgi:hypothetical protein